VLPAAGCGLADHILWWMTHIQEDMALRGTHLDNRYFLDQFTNRSLHALLRPSAVSCVRFKVPMKHGHAFARGCSLAQLPVSCLGY
jgi:hypothetical protein